ncbi:MAG: hypothetical protein OEM02_10460 [Desulfobulbaceae bacterium]|nr:hypothetical protein [Desulfobulbaceae bacterium]
MLSSLINFFFENIELTILSLTTVLLIALSITSGSFFYNNKKLVILSIILWAISFSVYRSQDQSCIATIHNYLNPPQQVNISQSQTINDLNDMPAPAAGFNAYGRIQKSYFKEKEDQ